MSGGTPRVGDLVAVPVMDGILLLLNALKVKTLLWLGELDFTHHIRLLSASAEEEEHGILAGAIAHLILQDTFI